MHPSWIFVVLFQNSVDVFIKVRRSEPAFDVSVLNKILTSSSWVHHRLYLVLDLSVKNSEILITSFDVDFIFFKSIATRFLLRCSLSLCWLYVLKIPEQLCLALIEKSSISSVLSCERYFEPSVSCKRDPFSLSFPLLFNSRCNSVIKLYRSLCSFDSFNSLPCRKPYLLITLTSCVLNESSVEKLIELACFFRGETWHWDRRFWSVLPSWNNYIIIKSYQVRIFLRFIS